MLYPENSISCIINSLTKALLFVLFCAYSDGLFAQAPNISYQTPQIYNTNTLITPLVPTNTGGPVPPAIYGQVSTLAGSGAKGSTDGQGTAASFTNPIGVATDQSGNIFVADTYSHLVREITPGGLVSTLAGNGGSGAKDGPAATASFGEPTGIAVDVAGNVYVADELDKEIRRISNGAVTTFTKTGFVTYTGGGLAFFNNPIGLAVDGASNVYVADENSNIIEKLTQAGSATILAGGAPGFNTGTGAGASFDHPYGIAIDGSGNIIVADYLNALIRNITPAGVVTTIAGGGPGAKTNGVGTAASFSDPLGVSVDIIGNIYVADKSNNLIRKITPAGLVSTLAGSGAAGATNGIGTAASFNFPIGVANDLIGSLYVTDQNNNLIRKISLTGYKIDKALPAGLVFDPTTGIITGTPTVATPATNYTITAYNLAGSSSFIVNIETFAGITFNAIPAKTVCDADFDPGATSTLGSAITYTSSNTAVATITGGKVHILGAGSTLITASNGIGSISDSLIVTAPPTPTVTITANVTSICAGTPVTYTAVAVNGGSTPVYQWLVNGMGAGTNSPTFVSTAITKTDVVQCMVSVTSGCPISGSSNKLTGIIVTPNTAPAISIQSSVNGPVCNGASITFTAAATNAGTNPYYQWQINGANAGSNSTTFTGNTFANGDLVTCILTNQGGACLTASTATSNALTVSLAAPPSPAPSVTIGASANGVYTNTSVTFTAVTANTTGATVAYQWMINGKNVGANTPTLTTSTLKNNDVVSCDITAIIGCSVSALSEQITMNILPIPPVVIPNTFTPNGDGINDTWNISNLAYYPTSTISIYNRYGTLLYQSRGYNVQWDGTYNGKPLPEGTYAYIIDLGTAGKLSGSVSIIR